MKYLAYYYPDEDNNDILVVQSFREVLKEWVDKVEKRYNSGLTCAEEAIYSHMAVHWAYISDREGKYVANV